MICKNCGSELSGEEKFCTNCGVKVEVETENTILESKEDVIIDNVNPIKSNDTVENDVSSTSTQPKKKSNEIIATLGVIVVITIAAVLMNITMKWIADKENSTTGSNKIQGLSKKNDKNNFKSNEIAVYDGGEITESEYDVYYRMFYSYLKEYDYDDNEIRDSILAKLIEDEIVYNDAIAAGYKLTDDDKKEIEDTFSSEEYIAFFEELGCDLESLKEIYAKDYVIQKYVDSFSEEEYSKKYDDIIDDANVEVNDSKLENYINSVKISE